jgi:hypothetical protein
MALDNKSKVANEVDASEDEDEIEDGSEGPLVPEQAPARMISPDSSEDAEKTVIGALVQEGVTRERAEELVETHGTDWESLKAGAWPENSASEENAEKPGSNSSPEEDRRKSILHEHHVDGIPPFETPGEKR